jgi:competence protein ComEC
VENSGYRLKSLLPARKVHSSWLIAAMSGGVIIGTVAVRLVDSRLGIEAIILSACLLLIGSSRRNKLSIGLFCIAGLLLGFYRGGGVMQSLGVYDQLIGTRVVVQGIVAEDPGFDIDGDIKLKLKKVIINEQAVEGELWVSSRQQVLLKRSDEVTISGNLSTGFGSIPAAVYRATVTDISRQDYADVARDTRDWFASGIRESIDEPEASLGSGFLLGQKSALPEKLDNELRLLGLTHIVVASGYNLSILIRYARRLFMKVSRFTSVAVSGLLVYGFANITGFSPSMTRASLITILSLIAWYYGRKFHPVVLLSFSAAITILINPSYAWGDIGWLLSFTSFIGVIMLSPLIHAYFWGEAKPGNVRQVFIETLSAQLLSLPLIMYVFGQYSSLALMANVLILPLIPIAMLLTFIAGIGGVILPGIASLIGWPAETLLRYMTNTVDYLAVQPLAGQEVSVSIEFVLGGYCLLLIMTIFLWRRTNYNFREYNIVE